MGRFDLAATTYLLCKKMLKYDLKISFTSSSSTACLPMRSFI